MPSLSGDGKCAAFTRVTSTTNPNAGFDVGHLFEGAYYWSPAGVVWSAGSNIVATPLL